MLIFFNREFLIFLLDTDIMIYSLKRNPGVIQNLKNNFERVPNLSLENWTQI